ncbi:MAG TPA: carboxymuconolactone decarboxylase family protein [Stellaceae bacterium]|jgi:uncharacterized peroxidase-related enzyme|nr:carboxymuconolactone decarboxylase family protein [Stellaceae bacterium]
MNTSRISTPAVDTATGATAELFAQIKKTAGGVPNLYAAVGALNTPALKSVLAAEGVLSAGTLGKKDLETIKLLVSEIAGCDYCVAAHSLLGKLAGFQPDALKQIRAAQPTGDAKRDALVRFVRNLQQTSGTISRDELDAIRAAGYTDAQLVEISLAIALTVFTNVFNRINDTTVDFPAVEPVTAA